MSEQRKVLPTDHEIKGESATIMSSIVISCSVKFKRRALIVKFLVLFHWNVAIIINFS